MTHSTSAAAVAAGPTLSVRGRGPRRSILFFAFAFAVIADPVSSVAYAIEAALRALHGDLALLLPTMSLVIGLVEVGTANYWQLVRRFPKGGGAAAAAGRAFGARWTFLPIGALVVDFVLTIGISIAAAASAVIALFPGLAPLRVPLALLLLVVVAGLTWFGHGGRLLFAVMTVAFVVISVSILILGFTSPRTTGHVVATTDPGPARSTSNRRCAPRWSKRTISDVSAVADPATGVCAYDSYGVTVGGYTFGGTGAAPITAGVDALATTPSSSSYPASFPNAKAGPPH
ncbi:hypothetical protein [Streptomyces sp. WM6386]|uniref:hypothetical protein n=1 Tax=Streptomyces sp. WM6386 TaxID=1415558 RepID=UPI000B179E4D